MSHTSSPVNVVWPSKRLVPTAECGPPQRQTTVLLTDLQTFCSQTTEDQICLLSLQGKVDCMRGNTDCMRGNADCMRGNGDCMRGNVDCMRGNVDCM